MRCHSIAGLGLSIALLAGCQSTSVIQEDELSAAGFSVRIADTTERQGMMNRLPPNQFVQRTSADIVHYVYADTTICGCLYIGTQRDFDQYVSNQRLDFEQATRIANLDFYDAAWNWDAWGPWETLGPIYGPGW